MSSSPSATADAADIFLGAEEEEHKGEILLPEKPQQRVRRMGAGVVAVAAVTDDDEEEEEEEKEEAVAGAVVIDAPATCRLRSFLTRVALELGYHSANALVDWHSLAVLSLCEESSDTEVLRTMRHGGYIVSRTLFWMQNTECLSHLHIMSHLIASREWTSRFLDVMRACTRPFRHRGRGAMAAAEASSKKHRSKRSRSPMVAVPTTMWQVAVTLSRAQALRQRLAEPLPVDDVVPVLPFDVPRRRLPPLPPAKQGASLTLSMLRDAAGNQDLTFDHMHMALDRACRAGLGIHEPAAIAAAVAKLEARHHGIVSTARLLAHDFAQPPSTSIENMHVQQERQALLRWIKDFLVAGCACTS